MGVKTCSTHQEGMWGQERKLTSFYFYFSSCFIFYFSFFVYSSFTSELLFLTPLPFLPTDTDIRFIRISPFLPLIHLTTSLLMLFFFVFLYSFLLSLSVGSITGGHSSSFIKNNNWAHKMVSERSETKNLLSS